MKILFRMNKANQQRQLEKMVDVYPVLYAMQATYLRNQGNEVVWDGVGDGSFDVVYTDDMQPKIDFMKLPYPDRVFTKGKEKRWQVYGNYKKHPASHMLSSNLCWYGRCVFCQDTQRLESGEKREVRSVDHVMEEIDDLISQGYREVFDDSGTFQVGAWLEEFCEKMQARKRKIKIGCNMKPVKLDYKMMANSGFRFILVGIESANQGTIDRIKKGQRNEDIVPIVRSMNDAGLEVHLTSMFGYEWESHEDAMQTVNLVHYLLKKGYAKTAQASIYMPPRTEPGPDHPAQKYVQKVYDIYKNPVYWMRKVQDIKCLEDIIYILKRLPLMRKAG